MTLKVLQSILGHTTLKMTMDLYGHVLKDYAENEMQLLKVMLDAIESLIDEKTVKTYKEQLRILLQIQY